MEIDPLEGFIKIPSIELECVMNESKFYDLSAVALKPTHPQNAAGIRIDPPISQPKPKGVHFNVTSPLSPPVEPPALRCIFQGFFAKPNNRFPDSEFMRH